MKHEFSGKNVLITGAASGIGRQTAFSFALQGAALILCDIDRTGLERTALLCRALGAQVDTHIADVASEEAMKELAERVHARIPALDVLVNNAGVGVAGSFVGTDLHLWHWAMSINLMGVVHGCHFFVPKMIERGQGGHVVNVASAAGLVANRDMPVYSASKFAVVGLSDSLRMELVPHRISVTTVCPGVIDTPITRNVRLSGHLSDHPDVKGSMAEIYRKRNYSPERVAEAIVEAARKGEGLLPVSPESWFLYYAKRTAPKLLERLMRADWANPPVGPAAH